MRHLRTTAVCATSIAIVVALLPTAAGAAPGDRQPAPGRSDGQALPEGRTSGRGLDRFAGSPGARAALGGGATVRLVVKADSPSTIAAARSSARLLGTTHGKGLAKLGYLTVDVPAADAAAAAADLAASPGVASVRIASARSLHLTPDDPRYASQQQSMMTAMQAPTAWDTSTGSEVTIAVLDGGFDVAHPDLAAKVVGTYDAVNGDTGVEDTPGWPGLGHGTATASTAAAVTGNGLGIAGSAPGADLLLVKVADDDDLLDSAYSATGIVWAADNGADVINMSYGGADADQVEADAIAYARSQGVVVVASAGNAVADVLNYPAAFPGVISVGATTNDGSAQAAWSTDGSWIDVAAPGENVPVALPDAADTDDGTVDGYSRWDGTSFSGPLVAGMAAVLRGHSPTAASTLIESAIVTTTKPISNTSGNASYGHGLVQFQAALDAIGTEIVVPAPGDVVTGDVAVSATSGASKVKFSITGTGITSTITTVAGTATGTLPTYGLAPGGYTITAASCSATACTAASDSVDVTVSANAAPVLTAPADGANVGTTLLVSASAPSTAAVKFVVDGTRTIGVDKTSPFSLSYDTAPLADGAHSVVAVLCTATATPQCDDANPSGTASFTVLRLRPTVKASVNPFSPNGDGRRDTATGTYTLEQTQTGTLRIYNASGTLVRGPVALGSKAKGTYAWSWTGRNNAGSLLADGTYKVEISTTGTKSAIAVKGLASTTVRLDRTKPSLSSVSASPSTVYPVKDGYKDSTSLGGTTKETVNAVTVTIYTSGGTKVRTLTSTSSKGAGRVALSWSGRTASGTMVKAGTYKYTVLVQDLAGNRTLTGKYTVYVSAKKLVKKSASKWISPLSYTDGYLADGDCSIASSGVWPGYDGAVGFFSRWYGCSNSPRDYVFGLFHYTLPSAVKYGSVQVKVYSGSHYANGDNGFAQLITAGDAYGRDWGLGSADGTYAGPWSSSTTYLKNGRTLRWIAGTADGNSYDVRNFWVAYSYYVLQ